MIMKKNLHLIALSLICGMAVSAHAAIVVTNSYAGPDGTVLKLADNSNFVTIQAPPGGAHDYSYTVTLGAGDTWSGYAAFSAWSTSSGLFSYNDSAKVSVSGGGLASSQTLWNMDAATAWSIYHSNGGNTDKPTPVNWQAWSFQNTSGTTQTYTFDYSMVFLAPSTRTKYDSVGLFVAVPEPSTWVSAGLLGTLCLVGGIRARRSALAQ